MVWAALALLVVSVVLTELLKPKPKVEDVRAAGLSDFKFPTATEGRVVPIVFGRVAIEGMNVVWFGNLTPVKLTKKIQKNLWSHFYATVGYRYHLGVQGALARRIESVRRFWIGDQLVWTGAATTGDGEVIAIDLPELFGGDEVGVGGVQMDLQVYLGTPTQPANAYLQAFQATPLGGGNVQPTYAGNAFVVARRLGSSASAVPPFAALNSWVGGAYVGNSETIKPWRFEVDAYPAVFSGQTAGTHKIGVDANPINVIVEILTNTEWGAALPLADVDIGPGSTFATAAATCHTEGNGFSYLLSKDIEAGELLAEIERQIDGTVFLDHLSGKWKIKLVRADYTLASQPLVDESNVIELREFTQGTWSDTINQVAVQFEHRDNDYKLATAGDQNLANMLTQGGGSVSTVKVVPGKMSFPGVKNATNAQNIASRELRSRSFPLARATVVVNRELFALTVGTVVRFSWAALGISELAMRVLKIDFGTITRGAITLSLVQDVFATLEAAFSAPPATNWTYPTLTLSAYSAADLLAIEAPRAVLVRDPEFSGDDTAAKVFAAVADVGGGISASIGQRNAAGALSGPFTVFGRVGSFCPVGSLVATLTAGSANPLASLTIAASPSVQSAILEAFAAGTTTNEMGTELAGLVVVGSEFMLVRAAVAAGPNVTLQTVYRGALDSGQQTHTSGARVFLLCAGANVSDGAVPNTNNIEVELRQESESAAFSGAVTPIAFTMAKRALRPYCPGAMRYNGAGSNFTTPSMEGAGSGIGGFRIDVEWWRRRYNTVDEVAELLADFTPDASTEYQLTVRADPAGANVLVGAASAWTSGAGPLSITRADILTAGPVGTLLRVALRARHDIGTEVDLESRSDLTHDVTPTSTLSGAFYFGGGVAANVATASYTAAATGTFTVAIGAAQATAAIQVSINGGAFATVVSSGSTSGTFSATTGDGIRLRRTVNEAPQPNYVELRNPSASVVAYGTFKA